MDNQYSVLDCAAGWFVKRGNTVVAHGFASRDQAEEFVWDEQNRKARNEFQSVKSALPIDPLAHPMSGRSGEY